MRNSMRLSAATPGVPLGHRLLHRDCAAHRIDDTGKFHQHPVAGGLDDAAVVLSDLRIEELAAQRFEAFERVFLIRPHQPVQRRAAIQNCSSAPERPTRRWRKADSTVGPPCERVGLSGRNVDVAVQSATH